MAENEKFMIVAFTEPQREYNSFQTWPQHMTILPWAVGHRLQATNRIVDAVRNLSVLSVTIGGQAMYGEDGNIPVWTVRTSEEVLLLHKAVLAATYKNDTIVEDMQYAGDGYSPHIAEKPDQSTRYIGETLLLPTISIIGKHMGHKTLFTNIEL